MAHLVRSLEKDMAAAMDRVLSPGALDINLFMLGKHTINEKQPGICLRDLNHLIRSNMHQSGWEVKN